MSILSAVLEFERDLLIERTKASIVPAECMYGLVLKLTTSQAEAAALSAQERDENSRHADAVKKLEGEMAALRAEGAEMPALRGRDDASAT